MPLASAPAIALVALVAIAAAITAWFLRGLRCKQEKRALNAVWQDQLEAKQTEHERLESQNSSLMQQVSQFQASIKDARNRSQELAELLREATDRRDELQREQKDLRSSMDKAAGKMQGLETEAAGRQKAVAAALKEKDDAIAHLKGEISNWHSRVQPLVERYRARNLEAQQLEVELEQARLRIAEFERRRDVDETRIEPMDSSSGILDASNDQFGEIAHNDMAAFDDQPLTPDGYEPGSGRYSHYSNENLGPRDDLKRIRGVGPAIEKTLNELGFFRFEQIAGLSDHDISRIADRLRGFSSRIHRDDWIGQARMLHYEKSDYAE